MYPQSDRSLVVVDINASKGFVDQWVHLSFAIFAIFDLKRQLKLPSSNMLNISLSMGTFSYKNWSKCSVVTLIFRWISMNFRSFTLFSSLKVHFRWKNYPSVGTAYIFDRGK